jgi:putative glutamine amidotransferase
MSQAHGLLLTGGGDVILGDEDGLDSVREMDRDRDFWEAALLEAAMELDKPVFGVCRGLQLMNKLLGGTLWNDIPSEFDKPIIHQQSEPRTEKSHKVILEPNSLIKRICGSDLIEVNTGHHQAAKDVAPDLKVTGRSPDGLIEVLEHRRLKFFLGVQWHPESLVPFDRVSETLFLAFINEAAACGSQ